LQDGRISGDPASLSATLRNFGFKQESINNALGWINSVVQHKSFIQEPSVNSHHIFTTDEALQIDTKCRQFLMFLEKNDVLTPKTRELVIHHLLDLKQRYIDITDIKWVTLIILFNQPEQRAALVRFEQMLFSGL